MKSIARQRTDFLRQVLATSHTRATAIVHVRGGHKSARWLADELNELAQRSNAERREAEKLFDLEPGTLGNAEEG